MNPVTRIMGAILEHYEMHMSLLYTESLSHVFHRHGAEVNCLILSD